MANTANINSLQLLRNTSKIFSGKTEAISQIKAEGTNDGTIKLARYTESGEVKTIFGIYYKPSGDSEGSYTIYGSPQEVIEALEQKVSGNTEAIATLNGADTVTGSVAKKIKDTIAGLSATTVSGSGQAIISISQENGVVSATAGDVAAEHVTIADADSAISATTVEGALTEINRKVTALTKSSEVTVSAKTGSGNVLNVYTIYQGGNAVGTIDIPKDLVVSGGSVVKGDWDGTTFTPSESGNGTALKLVIANQADPVYINTLDLVDVYTGENGINISDTNVVSIKLDTNEGYLSVSENGLKLSGVSGAIASAKTEVVKGNEGHVKVSSSANTTDGHLVYTISENDIASESALTAEIAARKAVDGISGSAYTANESTKYISTASSLNDADVKLDAAISGVTEGVGLNDRFRIERNPSGGTISAETKVSDALYTLDNAIAAAKKANSLSAATGTPLTVTTGDNGTTISVNIESASTVSHIVGYVASENGAGKFVYSDIAGIDAGTY